ncbi:MAG TPA: sensor histidine kinase, partial [Candidatus Olsenella avistercoris]|nr:sensor histidine kinase [Candidatus Olsenella avistercoris]
MAGLAQRGEKNPCPRTDSAQRRRATPLSLVIARYFAYVIVALAFVWVVAFTAFSMTMNAGLVYPANYGPSHDDEVAAAVREAGRVDDGLVPAAYRYVWLDDGSLIATDGDEHGVVAAIDAVEELGGEGSLAATDEVRSIGRDGTTYSVFALEDGSVCVLTSTYMPQYVTRGLRDALPNPQDLMLVAGCALSVGAVALVARRAARVISRKMAPLTEAAERIAREELDFAVEGSNVREVDDVLSAMERMRASLAESLEARWRSERAAREQVAALAHDLKTPLTVVRANADLLSEEAAEIGAAGEGLAESARAVAEGAAQLDGYVGLLVEASRGEAGEVRSLRTGARDLAARLADSAGRLAAARDVS